MLRTWEVESLHNYENNQDISMVSRLSLCAAASIQLPSQTPGTIFGSARYNSMMLYLNVKIYIPRFYTLRKVKQSKNYFKVISFLPDGRETLYVTGFPNQSRPFVQYGRSLLLSTSIFSCFVVVISFLILLVLLWLSLLLFILLLLLLLLLLLSEYTLKIHAVESAQYIGDVDRINNMERWI